MDTEFDRLPSDQRRKFLVRAALRPLLTATGLLLLYYLLPLEGPYRAGTVAVLAIGVLLVFGLVAWQTRAITQSRYPRLKGVETLVAAFFLFIVLFAAAYDLMDATQSQAFTQTMNRTDALYYTMTVFSTVGFGDIAPRSESARVVTMVQMLGDLLLLGVAVRVILGAVQVGLRRFARGMAPGDDAPTTGEN